MSHRFNDSIPHVTDEDLLDRIRLVEGPRFGLDGELRNAASGRPAAEDYARYRERYEADDDEEYRREKLSLKANTFIVIYGDSGWNRYLVRGDGSISFSRHHARSGSVEVARAAGFRVE